MKSLNVEQLINAAKDALDELHDISNPERRHEIAMDLMAYINLQFVDFPDENLRFIDEDGCLRAVLWRRGRVLYRLRSGRLPSS